MTRYASTLPSQVGRYQVVRAIGQGAMGQVLLAHDPVLDRPVAVKHLRDDLSLTSEQLAALGKRMEQEARAAARVAHPNLVALHDMGRDPIVGLFLVFEYVEGETLEERLRRGPLTSSEAARLSRELGGALSEAHAAQILHRDIKPENVLLAKTGAKIADFGVARLPDSPLTWPGGLLGTPAYSAPEAIDSGSFSPESDQFSMACTLFEAISARRAFPGDDAAVVAELVQTSDPGELARAFRLDARVDTVLARAFSKHPDARFPSCEEFGRSLAEALETHGRASMITQPDGYHRALALERPSRRGGVAGMVLLTLGLVVGFALVYKSGWRVSFAQSALPRHAAAVSDARDDAARTSVAWLHERSRPEPTNTRAAPPDAAAEQASRTMAPDAGVSSR
jgi:serine/threonine protein kinase